MSDLREYIDWQIELLAAKTLQRYILMWGVQHREALEAAGLNHSLANRLNGYIDNFQKKKPHV